MRYFLSVGDGKTYGPYDLEQLRSMQAEGRVPPTAQLCQEGTSAWMPSGQVLGGGMPAPSAPAMAPAPGAAGFKPVGLVGPILVTLFCCLIPGIVSIVYASSANSKGARGDIAGATAAAKASKTWGVVGIIAGVLGSIGYIALMVAAGNN